MMTLAARQPSVSRMHVTQGEFAVIDDPNVVLTTVLGSCVAACIRDPEAGVGGMNHFLLPEGEGDQVRYGAWAMEMLINGLLGKGARRERLQAKLFGGAKLFDSLNDVGQANARFAERFLRDEGIPLVNASTGGVRARRIEFWPVDGLLRQRFVTAAEAPRESLRPVATPVEDGSVELF